MSGFVYTSGMATRASGPLRRSRRHRLIAGVCGGVAERLGWRPSVVRALFVIGSLVPVLPGFVVYAVLWLVVPSEPRFDSSARGAPIR